MITDGQARRIAAEWHSGQRSAMCAFATSGAIERDRLCGELSSELQTVGDEQDRRDLLALVAYACRSGDRSPVRSWHRLWDDAPVPARET
ncbi:hypothetical protein [Actinopolymorpha sp. B9G3]|uniref:hypothetical protein n=1 Tax=Actinopolymorpha sp. B9G3 TaxID=3158970 RepID=UPI0032D91498